ncbi:MAG: hypothetical protein QOC89_3100 [Paraburkholderia sp.]|nr:hypothetical protein [Paraburkholderia sp.]
MSAVCFQLIVPILGAPGLSERIFPLLHTRQDDPTAARARRRPVTAS